MRSIKITFRFIEGKVRTISPSYRPHLVAESDNEYLGIQFKDTYEVSDNQYICSVECLYDGVNYLKLYQGREFEIKEGETVIATGIVLDGFGEKIDDNELRIRAHADGLAIGMENHINLMKAEIVFIPIFLLCSILGFTTTTDNNYIGFILLTLLGLVFVLMPFIVLLGIKYDDKVFLNGTQKMYIFKINDNVVYKDNKPYDLKNAKCIIYKYKRFIFMTIKKRRVNTFFIIRNDDYISGNREMFLNTMKQFGIVKRGY